MSEFKTGKNQQQVYLMFKVYPKIQRSILQNIHVN